jgi:hypothetical protein
MVREDVYDEWGWPGTTKHEEWEQIDLSDVMLSAQEVPQEAWLDEQEFPVTWKADADQDRETSAVQPVEVGHILTGGWGCRVYDRAVPATKASSWGPAGRTHLVSQRLNGKRRARRLVAEEVAQIFDPTGIMRVQAEDAEQRIADFGNSGPTRMVQPYAEGLVAFLKAPVAFVPERMEDLISTDTVQVCRGWMRQVAIDHDAQRKWG